MERQTTKQFNLREFCTVTRDGIAQPVSLEDFCHDIWIQGLQGSLRKSELQYEGGKH